MLCSRSVHVVKGLAVWGGKQALFFHLSSPNWGEQLWPTLQALGFGLHGSSGLLTATQPSRVELQMAGDHGKGQSCHVLLKSLHTVFSTWVLPTCLCRSRWSRGSVPVDQHLPGREQGWQRCQWSSQLLLSKEHSLRYPKDLPLYLVRRLQYTHRQLKLHTVVEDRQPFYWYCSTQNYSVLTKTWFIHASDCNILGPALVWWIYCIVWQI